jgi:hypothetical protein
MQIHNISVRKKKKKKKKKKKRRQTELLPTISIVMSTSERII